MSKLFSAVATVLMLAALGTSLFAEFYFDGSSPPLDESVRFSQRNEIITDVIDGRLSLLEAASAFHNLDRQSPPLLVTYPGDSDGEKVCRRVIAWVRVRLQSDPADTEAQPQSEGSTSPAASVLARLERELAAMMELDEKSQSGSAN